MNDEIVAKNIERMRSTEPGGMRHMLIRESMGGNAGRYKGFSCVGAGFYFDRETGEMLYFDNPQRVPADIRCHHVDDMFRLAVDWSRNGGTGKYRIIDYSPRDDVSQAAREVLTETIERYNREYGFDVESPSTL